jgi:hypothetical protein
MELTLMLAAHGWVIVRSSRALYHGARIDDVDDVDERVDAADEELFARLKTLLRGHEPPDLDWSFRPGMNNVRGVLMLSSSRNHRGARPTVLTVLDWLAENGPGSYGLVYIHDDEDRARVIVAGAETKDFSNVFRVWRLLEGAVEEFDDPFLSPLFPTVDAEALA